MPTQEDESVIFVAEAAYTHALLNEFRHSNIEGDHVSGGVRYKGHSCESNTGAFVYYNGTWKFCYDNYSYELDLAAENGGAGFGQEMIIYNGEIKQTARKDGQKNQFRALCEIGGRLCIADSNSVVTFGDFKQLLKAQNATNAIYLDMGDGWNHSWYRTNEGVVELHPKTHNYCTNWITFYKLLPRPPMNMVIPWDSFTQPTSISGEWQLRALCIPVAPSLTRPFNIIPMPMPVTANPAAH
jgi:hypothetical protein